MSGKPKYEDVTQLQLRLPRDIKGKIQQASQNTKRSVNEILVEGVGWLFDQPTWPPTSKVEVKPDTPGVVITREMTRAEADSLREALTPISISPWFWQLATLKMLSQEARGRVFMAIMRESNSEVSLPAMFRDMDQAEKAAWLDENCPLGGE